MKKLGLVLSIVTIFSFSVNAQDTLWRKGGLGALSFNQVGLSNWTGGGEDAISGNAILSLYANYAKKQIAWDNYLDLAYGLTKQGSSDYEKNDDRLEFGTKFGYKVGDSKWFYSVLASFKSQFDEGFATVNDTLAISKFAAPAYVVVSIGMDFKPDTNFSIYISPATGKYTIINDQRIANAGLYGNEEAFINDAGELVPGEKTRLEIGAYFKVMFKRDLFENVAFLTKLDLFSNYKDDPEHVDVNWEVLIGMKINRFLTASISTQLIYDHDVKVLLYEDVNGISTVVGTGPRTQFKEVFGIGLSYKFAGYSVK